MSLRLLSVQALHWSHLAPALIPLGGGVTVMCGANGSGKSSAMDAVKTALGARRFGQGRTPAHYIHRGPTGQSERAVILVAARGLSIIGPDVPDEGTLCVSVSRKSRRFTILPGVVSVAAPYEQNLRELLDAHPRERWLSPERWRTDVLEPLGVGGVMLRILELPQGEAHRVVQSKQSELVPQLLSMLGHRDRLDELESQRLRLAEARTKRDEARRAALTERRRVDTLAERARKAHELTARRDGEHVARLGLASALAHHLGTLTGNVDNDERVDQAMAAKDTAEVAYREALSAVRGFSGYAGPSTTEREQLLRAAKAIGAAVVDEHIAPASEHRGLVESALGRRRFALLATDDVAARALLRVAESVGVPVVSAPSEPLGPAAAGGLRALSRPNDPRVDAYLEAIDQPVSVDEETHAVRLGVEWLPESASSQDALTEALEAADQQRLAARAVHDQLVRERDAQRQSRLALQRELERLDVPDVVADAGDIDALRAAHRAAVIALNHLGSDFDDDTDGAIARHAAAEARLEDAERVLGEHDETLEQMAITLSKAQDVWRSEISGILGELRERFVTLAAAAGMEGDLVIEPEPMVGARIDIHVREHPGRPLKSFFRDGDLSGGWRVKIGLVLLLAALTGENSGCPLVMVDEHAASLDEDRAQELGDVFRRLADGEGLQFVLCSPTKRANEDMDWADAQVGFLAPEANQEWAPAPIVITKAGAQLSVPGIGAVS